MTKKSLRKVAEYLAEAHRAADPSSREVWLAPDKKGSEIRLIEVSEAVPSSGTVLPVRFQPGGEIEYPSVVVLLSAKEMDDVRKGRLKMPPGWGKPDNWTAI
jgi:hypothetical protein